MWEVKTIVFVQTVRAQRNGVQEMVRKNPLEINPQTPTQGHSFKSTFLNSTVSPDQLFSVYKVHLRIITLLSPHLRKKAF